MVSARDHRFRFRRASGRRHRVAGGLGRLILIGEEQLAPGLLQMPFDIVGEHTEKDVGADSIAQAMVDRADLQVHGLHRPKRPLDLRERFVMADATRAIQALCEIPQAHELGRGPYQ